MILRVALVATALVALGVLPGASRPQPPASPLPSATVAPAQLGVELPTLGGGNWWSFTRRKYVNAQTMQDIRDNLHATYVRTGWIPGRLRFEKFRWRREDDGMDIICSSGLRVMVILPGPNDDGKDTEDAIDNIREFFARYTGREPGCIRYAEVANEADLRANGFADVKAYASYYQRVAPIVGAYGITIITTGVSGEDRPWTAALAAFLKAQTPSIPVSGYGFHPYGVPPSAMAEATLAMREAAGPLPNGSLPQVYVTEIGQMTAADLYATIVNLAEATPAITVYEYLAQPGEDPRYGLKNNPRLYAAVQSAWEHLHNLPPQHDVTGGHQPAAEAHQQ
jgi:hypothetical protein